MWAIIRLSCLQCGGTQGDPGGNRGVGWVLAGVMSPPHCVPWHWMWSGTAQKAPRQQSSLPGAPRAGPAAGLWAWALPAPFPTPAPNPQTVAAGSRGFGSAGHPRAATATPGVCSLLLPGNLHTNTPHLQNSLKDVFPQQLPRFIQFESEEPALSGKREKSRPSRSRRWLTPCPMPGTALEPAHTDAGHPPALHVPSADKNGARRPVRRVTGMARAALFLRALKGPAARWR